MNIKIFNLLWVAALVLGGTSCTDMLEIKPENALTSGEFWKTREDAVASIVGAYATFRSNQEALIYWGEIRGELLSSVPGKGAGTDKESFDVYLIQPSNSMLQYTNFYKVINEANLIIKNVPGIVKNDPALTQEEADRITGEARFLRAFSYFWLVRTFKEVPLTLEPSESDAQNYNIPKSPADSIFAQILTDIKIAEKTLPADYGSIIQTKGRATKYAAYAFEADVDLWMGKFQEAISACNQVINSKQYALLTADDYSTLFIPGNTGESIWELQYSTGQTNSLYTWFNQRGYFNGLTVSLLFTDVNDVRNGNSVSSTGQVQKYNVSTNTAHWILYRLADVILMKAEALAHLVPDDPANLDAASQQVNLIRKRARISLIPPFVSTLDADNTLLDERGRELCFEGKRWFDLVRFASRNNFVNKDLLINRVEAGATGVDQLVISTRVDNPEGWYLPLNLDALTANPALVQNPYYQ